MNKVFVSIGSNIEPSKNIDIVKTRLNGLFKCKYSSTYETQSEGFNGSNFLNAVVSFQTKISPLQLKKVLKSIEIDMGRNESQKGMSSRVIDLDIILFGDLVINEDGMVVPDKGVEEYVFVLEPLVEIAGEMQHPILQISFAEMLKKLKRNSI